jgi:plastocyanin
MRTLAFEPTSVSARVGQTVQWTNEDNVFHNVIYLNGPKFKSSPQHIKNGETFSIVPTQAGTIHYFCSIHPWMKGSITVSK